MFAAWCTRRKVVDLQLRLSMGISDEIEDATIAIDEKKISEIEATIYKFEAVEKGARAYS